MDLIREDLGRVFRKYFVSSMGSAIIMSVYLFVDAVIVGQAEGPAGAATMAVMTPAYGILIFLSLVCGIGGSVRMSAAWGEGNRDEGNRYFTCAVILMGIVTVAIWLMLLVFHEPLLRVFGADDEIYATTMNYAWWIIGFAPLMMLSVFLACFVRNDGNPTCAMLAVLVGGSLNMVGDWALVFPVGMGISGAGLATVVSNGVQIAILSTHFISGKNHMALVRQCGFRQRAIQIVSVGFGAGMLDLANVILFTLMNRQVMVLGGATYLALFSAASTLSTFFQSMFSGVGQALQPVASVNYGAKKMERVRGIRNRAVLVAGGMGLCCSLFGILFPELVVQVTMDATEEIMSLAHIAVRPYSVIFLFMALNVVGTYYLQSTLQDKLATVVSLLRGLLISGLMIYLLPQLIGPDGTWWAMPVAEILVCVLSMVLVFRKAGRTWAK